MNLSGNEFIISPEMDQLLSSFPNYVMLIDEKHNILYANSKITNEFNILPERLIGKYCPKVIHGVDSPIEECPLEECVITNVPIEREIFDSINNRWVSSAIYPTELISSEGLKIFVHMTHDISKRKTAEVELHNSLVQMKKLTDDGINAIALIVEKRDPYTAGHQQRVSKLASLIALHMGLDERTVDCIKKAGSLHDVGKIAIPIEILSKPGLITEDEYRMIKSHPQVGYDILKNINFGLPIADIILQHHERLDGSGYPKGLKGDSILLEAKIISVSDVIEAMASHRPYRPSLGYDKALDEIKKNRGVLYEPAVVDTCLKLFIEDNFNFN